MCEIRLSVCLSHCGIVSKRCPKDSGLSWQNFMLMGDGVPLERGHQRGVPPLRRLYFVSIGFYRVKMVADSKNELRQNG